jgi:hypothetical protein
MKRDLKADLELCNKATLGPWEFHEVEFQCGRDECPYEKKREDNSCLKCDGVEIYQSAFVPEVLTLGCGEYDGMNDADAEFIAEAREGWPHAIERALKAEADFKRQEEYSDMLEDEHNELYNLARELVEALEEALLLTTIFMHTDESDLMKTECEMVLAKAKEVLGDGDHQRQGG